MARRRSWFPAAASLTLLVWAAPTCLCSETAPAVAPGDMVRVRPPARIVIPEVITMERGSIAARVPYEEKEGLVVVQDGPRTIHLPRPGRRVTGRLVSVTDETITLREGGNRTICIPRQAVERLEVRQGGENRWLGVMAGAAAGFALGYALGYSSEKDCSGWCMPEIAGAGLGVLCAIPGAIVGQAAAGGHWEPVSTNHLRVRVAQRQGGGTATVSIRF